MAGGLEKFGVGFLVVPLLAIEEIVRASLVVSITVDSKADLASLRILSEDSFVAIYPAVVALAFTFDFLFVTCVGFVEGLVVIFRTSESIELSDLYHLVEIKSLLKKSSLGAGRCTERMSTLSDRDLDVVTTKESREEFVFHISKS